MHSQLFNNCFAAIKHGIDISFLLIVGSNKWQKVPGVIKDTEATARNLDEGTEYEFRVMAVNEHGESEPLLTEQAIKAKHPFGK